MTNSIKKIQTYLEEDYCEDFKYLDNKDAIFELDYDDYRSLTLNKDGFIDSENIDFSVPLLKLILLAWEQYNELNS